MKSHESDHSTEESPHHRTTCVPENSPSPGKWQRLRRFRLLAFPFLGLLSLIWFLVRVIPKPIRATYPCQRAAFPVASAFIVWVMSVLASAAAWRKACNRHARFWQACLWGAVALACAALVITSLPTFRALAGNPPHAPLGVAKGIFPGRVVWVYGPQATSWGGYSSAEHWFDSNHTDIAVVDQMISKGLQSVAGGASDAESWDKIFKYFNQLHGKGARGYAPREKIAIKINLTTCNGRSGTATVDLLGSYEKRNGYSDGAWLNTIDNSPQMLLTLLRQLVYTVGVAQTNIFLGDPTGNFPAYMWNILHPEFPQVHYFDNYGGAGRMRVELSSVPFYWSVTNANSSQPLVQDYVPIPFAQADYIINCAVLKGHSVGITVCGKNWYGSLLRCPDGYSRDAFGPNQGGNTNYSSMHASAPDPAMGIPGMTHYRAIVDLMGSPSLGGKTLLFMVDGLFGGYFWDSHPKKWKMTPFNTNWPSSLFLSLDPVAIDSVCYDFLLNEWPNVVNNGSDTAGTGLQGGAEDYLHEEALANNPPSKTFYDPAKSGTPLASLGVHEHWNNPIDKQYSRNLDPVNGTGIELVQLTAGRPAPLLSITASNGQALVSWRSSLVGFHLQKASNLAPPALWSDVTTAPTMNQWSIVVASDMSDASRFYRLMKPPPPVTFPTFGNGGNPWLISSNSTVRIEAENFDTGGEGISYHDVDTGNNGGQYRTADAVDIESTTDTGAGYDVGWIAAGEWLIYTVRVEAPGTYTLRLRVARQPTGTGSVRVSFDGVDKTGAMSLPSTGGWQTWTTISKSGLVLGPGIQTMRIDMLSDGFNVNWLELSPGP
jgi:Carbohydrate binding module (family 6)/Domain of unknown function (DUF362)